MSDPKDIVSQMLEKDAFSNWLGITVLEITEGYCQVKMMVRADMINGHGVLHGGVSFSLADSAFAFASNAHGQKAVSIDASVNHIKPVFEGEELIATASKESASRRLGHYLVRITRNEELVAIFKGVVFRKDKKWKDSVHP